MDIIIASIIFVGSLVGIFWLFSRRTPDRFPWILRVEDTLARVARSGGSRVSALMPVIARRMAEFGRSMGAGFMIGARGIGRASVILGARARSGIVVVARKVGELARVRFRRARAAQPKPADDHFFSKLLERKEQLEKPAESPQVIAMPAASVEPKLLKPIISDQPVETVEATAVTGGAEQESTAVREPIVVAPEITQTPVATPEEVIPAKVIETGPLVVDVKPPSVSEIRKVVEEVVSEDTFQRVEEKWLKALSQDPKNIEAYKKLGKLYFTMKNFEYARECFLAAQRLGSRDIRIAWYLRKLEA